jgi:hypothetical protein
MGWHYRRSYETVLVASRPGAAHRWYDETSTIENVIRPGAYGIRKIIPTADEHPTQKPVQLAEHFIKLHTRPGDLVLDPLMEQAASKVDPGKDIRSWTVGEFLEKSSLIGSYTEKIMSGLQGKKLQDIDFSKMFQELFNNQNTLKELSEDPTILERFQKIAAEMKEADLHLDNAEVRARFVLFCTREKNTSVAQLRSVAQEGEEQHFVTFIEKINERSKNTKTYLQTFTHGHKRVSVTGNGEKSSTVLEKRMEHLNVQDTLQIFAYLNGAEEKELPKSAKDTPALLALLLQMKVMHLIHEEDKTQGLLFRDWLVKEYLASDTSINLPPQLRNILGVPSGRKMAEGIGGALAIGVYKVGQNINELSREVASKAENFIGVPYDAAKPVAHAGIYYGLGRGTLGALADWNARSAGRLAKDLNFSSSTVTRITDPTMWERFWNHIKPFHPITRALEARELRAEVLENLRKTGKSAEEVVSALHGRNYRFATIEKSMLKAGFQPSEIEAAIAHVKKTASARGAINGWRMAAPWQRAPWVGGVGLQGLLAYQDWQQIDTEKDQKKAVEEHGKSIMDELKKRLDADPQFRREGDKYVHITSGVEISMKRTEQKLDEATGMNDTRVAAQRMRTAASAAGLATTVLMGAKVFTGPVGLVVAGVELGVRAGINAWEQGKMRNFITSVSPFWLAALGVQDTAGESSYDVLTMSSSWMASDLTEGKEDHAEIRNRMLFTMFFQDLKRDAPTLLEEITAGLNTPEALDAFYATDFQKIVLPFYAARLYQTTKKDAPWSLLKTGAIDKALIGEQEATFLEVRRALQDSAVFYIQHIREKRYQEHRDLLEEQEEEGIDTTKLQDLVKKLGEVSAFGKPAAEGSRPDGKTQAEAVLSELQQALEQAKGDTRSEKLASTQRLFHKKIGSTGGKERYLDEPYSMVDFLEDPILREKLKQVFPLSTKDKEARIYPTLTEMVLGGKASWLLRSPVGRDDGKMEHDARSGAGFLGMPVALDASFEAAQQAITLGAVQQREAYAGAQFQRNDALFAEIMGRAKYTPKHTLFALEPVLNDDLQRQIQLCQNVHTPDTTDKEFAPEQVYAVFFQGFRAKNSGANTVLATYVYRDPKKPLTPENIRVVQQGAVMIATDGGRGVTSTRGRAVAFSGKDFEQQPNGKTILASLLAADIQSAKDAEIAQKKEEAEKPARDAREAEAKKQIEERDRKMMERAEKSTTAFTQIPNGKYGRMYGTQFVTTVGPSNGASMSAPQPYFYGWKKSEGNNFLFDIKNSTDQKIRTLRIEDYTFMERQDMLPDEKTMMRDLITTPLEGNPKASLERVIDLFPHFVNGRVWLKAQLVQELLPLYETAKAKKTFLINLFGLLVTETKKQGGINEDVKNHIKSWFAEHERMFVKDDPVLEQ